MEAFGNNKETKPLSFTLTEEAITKSEGERMLLIANDIFKTLLNGKENLQNMTSRKGIIITKTTVFNRGNKVSLGFISFSVNYDLNELLVQVYDCRGLGKDSKTAKYELIANTFVATLKKSTGWKVNLLFYYLPNLCSLWKGKITCEEWRNSALGIFFKERIVKTTVDIMQNYALSNASSPLIP